MGKFFDWLDDRTGVRSLAHEALYERVPGGARWRYVWGSTLVMAFVTQAITGTFLWMAYSPSTQTAWESVFYIQFEIPGGWLLRGIHHYMAHAMVMLLGIHFAQVVWDGAYRAPRELNFVIGMFLMLVVFALALTGYLLPWDQKGYWATSVGTNLASQAPLAGPDIRKLAIGGTDYGHLTLTRFFALHAGVLPGLLMVLLVPHLMLFRRHGLHARQPITKPDAYFWPDQLLKDSVAALGVLVAVLVFAVYGGGADLTAPADPSNPYNAARPEWYFLFLFQFLKWFPGELEVWGAIVIPTIFVVLMFLMPWIGRTQNGHRFNVALLIVVLGGVALLTGQAVYDDNYAKWHERTESNADRYDASTAFLDAKKLAEQEAGRVVELARTKGIPPAGALKLIRDDPYLQGPKLFTLHCAGCHTHETPKDYEEMEHRGFDDRWININNIDIVNPKPSAPNLAGVGEQGWVWAILHPERVGDKFHLGYEGSPFAEGDMVNFVRDSFGEDVDPSSREAVDMAVFDIKWALSGEADQPFMRKLHASERRVQDSVKRGRELITGGLADIVPTGTSCVDCHKFHDAGELGMAPDLTGYMSREWMIDFIKNPAAERFYGDRNDRMPAFAPHDDPRLNQLDDKSIELIVDWLRGDWAVPDDEFIRQQTELENAGE